MSSNVSSKSKLPQKAKKLSKQDERLTGRHIKALMSLQDARQEIEELQSKLDIKTKELSSCYNLHELARSSQRRLIASEKSLEEALKQLKQRDEEIKDMKETHKVSIEKLKASTATELASLKASNSKLEEELLNLKKEADRYEKDMISMNEKDSCIQELQNKCQDLHNCLTEVKSVLGSKTDRESELDKELSVLHRKNVTLECSLREQKERVDFLEARHLERKQFMDKLTSDSQAYAEVSRLKDVVQSLTTELESKETAIKDLEDQKGDLDHLLSVETDKLRLTELERDTLKQSADDLRQDLEYIQSDTRRISLVKQSGLTHRNTEGDVKCPVKNLSTKRLGSSKKSQVK